MFWHKNFARNRRFLRPLLGIGDSKVSNLKMADYDKEIPFGDGVGNRGVDDGDAIEMQNLDPYDSSSRRGSEDTTYRSSRSRTYGETSFIEGTDEHTPLLIKEEEEEEEEEEERDKALAIKREEEKRDKAWAEIKRKFPKVDTTKFTATLDDIGRVFVKLIRSNAKPAPLFNKDSEVNEKLRKTIIEALGPRAEDIVETNREEISRHEKKNRRIKSFT